MAQRGDAFLATQSLQNNADLLFGRILLARLTADIPNRLLGVSFVVIDFCLIFLPLRVSTMSQKSSLMQTPQSAP